MKNNKQYTIIVALLLLLFSFKISGQTCNISLNDPSSFVFSSSGGIQIKSYTVTCSSPTITFSGVPNWVTITAESGNIIKADCPPSADYNTASITILVNGNPMGGFGVTQGVAPPSGPCIVTGFGNETYDSFGETKVFPLTFSDCSPATSATFTFQTNDGSPVPDWISITQTGTSISIITSPHDSENQQRPIIKGTAQISGDTVLIYAEVKQNSCLQTWYKDVDGDGYAALTTRACNSPGTGYALTTIPLGDCDDANDNVYPGALEVCDNVDNDCNNQIDENKPQSPNVDGPSTVCLGSTAGLSITSNHGSNIILRWYSGSTIVNEGISYNPVINGLQTYQVAAYNTQTQCESNKVNISVNPYSEFEAGIINNWQTVCYNGNPNILGSTSLPSGGDGTYTYQWESSLNNSTWTTISNATNSTYDPPSNQTATKWYRRIDSNTTCSQSEVTNSVKVSIRDAVVAGVLKEKEPICYSGNPTSITSLTAPLGGTGVYTYQWQTSNNGSSNWTNISGAISESYDPPGSETTTKWYQRLDTSCGQTKTTNSIEIAVRSEVFAGSISNNQTICYGGSPSTINSISTASGGTNNYVYKWEVKTSSNGTWTTISGETSESYTPSSNETITKWYRRGATSCLAIKYTPTVEITVLPSLGAPTGLGTVSVCSGNSVSVSLAPSTGGNVIRWYNQASGGTHFDEGNLDLSNVTSGVTYYASTYNSNGSVNCESSFRKAVEIEITGQMNYYLDADGDGYGSAVTPACENPDPSIYVTNITGSGTDDIDDTNDLITNIPPSTFYYDSDTDGFGDATQTKYQSIQPAGYVTDNTDCNDGDININPNTIWYLDGDNDDAYVSFLTQCDNPGTGYTITELVNQDCDDNDDQVQEPTTWYLDADGDGFTSSQVGILNCGSPGATYTSTQSQEDDCNDNSFDNTNSCVEVPEVTYTGDNYVYTRSYQAERLTATDFFTASEGVIQQITYFDGLGRPIQQIGIDQTPLKHDIITHIAYDDYGRAEKEYLPYATTDSNLGTHRPTALTDTESFYNKPIYEDTQNAFSQKEFEPSPLNRVLKQAAPGNDWALGTGHEIELDYASNTYDPLNPTDSNNDNVRLFKVDFINDDTELPQLTEDNFYAANELYKTITKDENHDGTATKLHTTEEFTDKQGRVVLKRTYAEVETQGVIAVEPHDTYYVYDDFGNLTYVLPPLMNAGDTQTTLAELNNNMAALGYQYKYDHRNRLVEKQIPGKGKEYIVYNKLDQPIMTQDANQREYGEWLFTKYDVFGRVAYTGKAQGVSTLTREEVQTEADSFSDDLWVIQSSTAIDFGSTTSLNYNNGAYPNNESTDPEQKVALTEVLTINYYDSYDFDHAGTGTTASSFGVGSTTNVKGLATGSKVKVLDEPGDDVWITTVSYYDEKARPIYSYSENEYLGTVDVVSSKLDFVGKPLMVRSSHTRNSTTVVTLDNFTYDHVGRLLNQTQCIGDETLLETCTESTSSSVEADVSLSGVINDEQVATNSITVTDATLTPNAWLHIDPSAGGSGGTEELIVANTYDELGQLQSKNVGGLPTGNGLQTINYGYNVRGWLKSINQDANTQDNDLFNFGINYNTVSHGGTPLYNGNISETQWETANIDSNQKWYTYSYDALNRITGATDNTDKFNLSGITYDKNGNIQTLKREGWTVQNPSLINNTGFGTMDNLTYSYASNSNKLIKVTDAASLDEYGFKDDALNTAPDMNDDYNYDTNGNMTSDLNKGVTLISYNHLNLPTQVSFNSGGIINYVYDAAGTKLKKTTSNGAVTEYSGNYVYSGNTTSTALQFFNHPEGYVSSENSNYRYVYQYKDHVGNVRLSYTDNPSNPGTPTIIGESNYYPFGLEHKGYNSGGDTALGNDLAQNWKFGGKEFDETFNIDTYDFGSRNYMPDIGRWGNIDPLADKFYEHSPYSYARNNPIFFVDPDGNEPIPGPFTGRVIADKYGTLRAYRITSQQRYILDVQSSVASAATGLYGAAVGLYSATNSSEPNWVERANERAKALVGLGTEGFDAFINSESMKPFRGKEAGKFFNGLSKGFNALDIGLSLSNTEATAQERLEEFTFAFGAALIGPAEQSSNEGILFVSGSAGKSKESFENDLNTIFLGVSLLTQDFDLTTEQGAADAANYLQENQKIVTGFIKFLQQQNRKLEEQNEGQ